MALKNTAFRKKARRAAGFFQVFSRHKLLDTQSAGGVENGDDRYAYIGKNGLPHIGYTKGAHA